VEKYFKFIMKGFNAIRVTGRESPYGCETIGSQMAVRYEGVK
jgi:hypothetical protein